MKISIKLQFVVTLLLFAAINQSPAEATPVKRATKVLIDLHTKVFNKHARSILGREGSRRIVGFANGVTRNALRRLATTRPVTENHESDHGRTTFTVQETGANRRERPDDLSLALESPTSSDGGIPSLVMNSGLPEDSLTKKYGATTRGIGYIRHSNYFDNSSGEKRLIKTIGRGFVKNDKGVVFEQANLTQTKVDPHENGIDHTVKKIERYYRHDNGKRSAISASEYAEGMKDIPNLANPSFLHQDLQQNSLYNRVIY